MLTRAQQQQQQQQQKQLQQHQQAIRSSQTMPQLVSYTRADIQEQYPSNFQSSSSRIQVETRRLNDEENRTQRGGGRRRAKSGSRLDNNSNDYGSSEYEEEDEDDDEEDSRSSSNLDDRRQRNSETNSKSAASSMRQSRDPNNKRNKKRRRKGRSQSASRLFASCLQIPQQLAHSIKSSPASHNQQTGKRSLLSHFRIGGSSQQQQQQQQPRRPISSSQTVGNLQQVVADSPGGGSSARKHVSFGQQQQQQQQQQATINQNVIPNASTAATNSAPPINNCEQNAEAANYRIDNNKNNNGEQESKFQQSNKSSSDQMIKPIATNSPIYLLNQMQSNSATQQQARQSNNIDHHQAQSSLALNQLNGRPAAAPPLTLVNQQQQQQQPPTLYKRIQIAPMRTQATQTDITAYHLMAQTNTTTNTTTSNAATPTCSSPATNGSSLMFARPPSHAQLQQHSTTASSSSGGGGPQQQQPPIVPAVSASANCDSPKSSFKIGPHQISSGSTNDRQQSSPIELSDGEQEQYNKRMADGEPRPRRLVEQRLAGGDVGADPSSCNWSRSTTSADCRQQQQQQPTSSIRDHSKRKNVVQLKSKTKRSVEREQPRKEENAVDQEEEAGQDEDDDDELDNLNGHSSLLALSSSSNSTSSVASLVGHDSALADTLQCDLRIATATTNSTSGASNSAQPPLTLSQVQEGLRRRGGGDSSASQSSSRVSGATAESQPPRRGSSSKQTEKSSSAATRTSIMAEEGANVDRRTQISSQRLEQAPTAANAAARVEQQQHLKNDNHETITATTTTSGSNNIEPPGEFKDTTTRTTRGAPSTANSNNDNNKTNNSNNNNAPAAKLQKEKHLRKTSGGCNDGAVQIGSAGHNDDNNRVAGAQRPLEWRQLGRKEEEEEEARVVTTTTAATNDSRKPISDESESNDGSGNGNLQSEKKMSERMNMNLVEAAASTERGFVSHGGSNNNDNVNEDDDDVNVAVDVDDLSWAAAAAADRITTEAPRVAADGGGDSFNAAARDENGNLAERKMASSGGGRDWRQQQQESKKKAPPPPYSTPPASPPSLSEASSQTDASLASSRILDQIGRKLNELGEPRQQQQQHDDGDERQQRHSDDLEMNDSDGTIVDDEEKASQQQQHQTEPRQLSSNTDFLPNQNNNNQSESPPIRTKHDVNQGQMIESGGQATKTNTCDAELREQQEQRQARRSSAAPIIFAGNSRQQLNRSVASTDFDAAPNQVVCVQSQARRKSMEPKQLRSTTTGRGQVGIIRRQLANLNDAANQQQQQQGQSESGKTEKLNLNKSEEMAVVVEGPASRDQQFVASGGGQSLLASSAVEQQREEGKTASSDVVKRAESVDEANKTGSVAATASTSSSLVAEQRRDDFLASTSIDYELVETCLAMETKDLIAKEESEAAAAQEDLNDLSETILSDSTLDENRPKQRRQASSERTGGTSTLSTRHHSYCSNDEFFVQPVSFADEDEQQQMFARRIEQTATSSQDGALNDLIGHEQLGGSIRKHDDGEATITQRRQEQRGVADGQAMNENTNSNNNNNESFATSTESNSSNSATSVILSNLICSPQKIVGAEQNRTDQRRVVCCSVEVEAVTAILVEPPLTNQNNVNDHHRRELKQRKQTTTTTAIESLRNEEGKKEFEQTTPTGTTRREEVTADEDNKKHSQEPLEQLVGGQRLDGEAEEVDSPELANDDQDNNRQVSSGQTGESSSGHSQLQAADSSPLSGAEHLPASEIVSGNNSENGGENANTSRSSSVVLESGSGRHREAAPSSVVKCPELSESTKIEVAAEVARQQQQAASQSRSQSPSPPTTVSDLDQDEDLSMPSFVDTCRQQVEQLRELAASVASEMIEECLVVSTAPATTSTIKATSIDGELVEVGDEDGDGEGDNESSLSTATTTTTSVSYANNSYVCPMAAPDRKTIELRHSDSRNKLGGEQINSSSTECDEARHGGGNEKGSPKARRRSSGNSLGRDKEHSSSSDSRSGAPETKTTTAAVAKPGASKPPPLSRPELPRKPAHLRRGQIPLSASFANSSSLVDKKGQEDERDEAKNADVGDTIVPEARVATRRRSEQAETASTLGRTTVGFKLESEAADSDDLGEASKAPTKTTSSDGGGQFVAAKTDKQSPQPPSSELSCQQERAAAATVAVTATSIAAAAVAASRTTGGPLMATLDDRAAQSHQAEAAPAVRSRSSSSSQSTPQSSSLVDRNAELEQPSAEQEKDSECSPNDQVEQQKLQSSSNSPTTNKLQDCASKHDSPSPPPSEARGAKQQRSVEAPTNDSQSTTTESGGNLRQLDSNSSTSSADGTANSSSIIEQQQQQTRCNDSSDRDAEQAAMISDDDEEEEVAPTTEDGQGLMGRRLASSSPNELSTVSETSENSHLTNLADHQQQQQQQAKKEAHLINHQELPTATTTTPTATATANLTEQDLAQSECTLASESGNLTIGSDTELDRNLDQSGSVSKQHQQQQQRRSIIGGANNQSSQSGKLQLQQQTNRQPAAATTTSCSSPTVVDCPYVHDIQPLSPNQVQQQQSLEGASAGQQPAVALLHKQRLSHDDTMEAIEDDVEGELAEEAASGGDTMTGQQHQPSPVDLLPPAAFRSGSEQQQVNNSNNSSSQGYEQFGLSRERTSLCSTPLGSSIKEEDEPQSEDEQDDDDDNEESSISVSQKHGFVVVSNNDGDRSRKKKNRKHRTDAEQQKNGATTSGLAPSSPSSSSSSSSSSPSHRENKGRLSSSASSSSSSPTSTSAATNNDQTNDSESQNEQLLDDNNSATTTPIKIGQQSPTPTGGEVKRGANGEEEETTPTKTNQRLNQMHQNISANQSTESGTNAILEHLSLHHNEPLAVVGPPPPPIEPEAATIVTDLSESRRQHQQLDESPTTVEPERPRSIANIRRESWRRESTQSSLKGNKAAVDENDGDALPDHTIQMIDDGVDDDSNENELQLTSSRTGTMKRRRKLNDSTEQESGANESPKKVAKGENIQSEPEVAVEQQQREADYLVVTQDREAEQVASASNQCAVRRGPPLSQLKQQQELRDNSMATASQQSKSTATNPDQQQQQHHHQTTSQSIDNSICSSCSCMEQSSFDQQQQHQQQQQQKTAKSSTNKASTAWMSQEEGTVFTENYWLAHWLYISEFEEAEIWRRSIDMSEQQQQREKSDEDGGQSGAASEMCETSSTHSEKNFSSRYKSTTRKMIHRRATIEMYKRIMCNRLKREKRVEISRSNGEFGFRIHGSRPVVVSAIERGTSAETCGLQVGDLIYSINGTNILDMAHSEVVKLAHNADSASLILDLVPTNDFLQLNKYKPGANNSKRYEPIVTGFLMRLSPSTAQPLLIDLQAQMSSGQQRGGNPQQASCSQRQRAAKLVQVMRLAWRKRYFVLRADNCLYWYKSPNDVEPHGGINLQGFSATLTDEFSEPNYVIRLIRYGGQPHYLGTDNMCDIQTWVDSINRAATEANQNDPYMKQTLSLARGQANRIPEPDCCGWLYKFSHKKGGGAHWRPAYFVLKDACLYLFRDQLQQQPERPSVASIDPVLLLANNQQASAVYYLHGYRVRSKHIENKRHTFELLPPNRKTIRPIFLMATNEIEKKRWIAALEYSIDRWIEID